MEKQKIYALFNKKTKMFIGFSLSVEVVMNDRILVKTLELENNTNLAMYEWVGDYDTGALVSKANIKEKVDERVLWEKFKEKFFRKYDIGDAIILILQHLAKFRRFDEVDVKHYTPDMNEMLDFLEKSIDRNAKELEFFRNSDHHELRTEEDLKRETEQRFAT
jgi:hypothetical protein